MARLQAEKGIDQIAEAFDGQYSNLRTTSDPAALRYLVRHVLTRPKEVHSLTVFRRHLYKHYGSTVIAWRQAMGNNSLATFSAFREVCSELSCRPKATEYWEALDSGFAGNISLFELDPDAVVLLAKFHARLLGLVDDAEADVETLFKKLLGRTISKLNTPGKLDGPEFRSVVKVLGFNRCEADSLFQYLDGQGGRNRAPPATVSLLDIAWLKKLPLLVHLDSAMLQREGATTMLEQSRLVVRTHTAGGGGARRLRAARPSFTATGASLRPPPDADEQGEELEEEEGEEEEETDFLESSDGGLRSFSPSGSRGPSPSGSRGSLFQRPTAEPQITSPHAQRSRRLLIDVPR